MIFPQSLVNKFHELSKHKFVRHFLPFMILIVGGSFALKDFTEVRYKYTKSNMMVMREDLKKKGVQMKAPGEVTLESEYEKIQKMDIDNWENVRIPRPWEEGQTKKE